MPDKLNINEIIKVAINIEKNGKIFYEKLAEKFSDLEDISKLFKYLGAEEVKHEAKFTNFLNQIEEYSPYETYTDEYDQYIRELSKYQVFVESSDLDNKLINISKPEEALKVALQFERDSVVYFTSLKEYFFGPDDEMINKIIKEEITHVFSLMDISKSYSSN